MDEEQGRWAKNDLELQEKIDKELPRLLDAILTWCEVSGDHPLKQKVWHWQFGEWEVIVNAKLEVVGHTTIQGHDVLIKPGHFKFEYNGFPAGDLDLNGNGWFAAGSQANLETCIQAIKEKTDAVAAADDDNTDAETAGGEPDPPAGSPDAVADL